MNKRRYYYLASNAIEILYNLFGVKVEFVPWSNVKYIPYYIRGDRTEGIVAIDISYDVLDELYIKRGREGDEE